MTISVSSLIGSAIQTASAAAQAVKNSGIVSKFSIIQKGFDFESAVLQAVNQGGNYAENIAVWVDEDFLDGVIASKIAEADPSLSAPMKEAVNDLPSVLSQPIEDTLRYEFEKPGGLNSTAVVQGIDQGVQNAIAALANSAVGPTLASLYEDGTSAEAAVSQIFADNIVQSVNADAPNTLSTGDENALVSQTEADMSASPPTETVDSENIDTLNSSGQTITEQEVVNGAVTGTSIIIADANSAGDAEIETYNANGTLAQEDFEHPDGTSTITVFNNPSGSQTSTDYSGPFGTGSATANVVSQITGGTYTYTGKEILQLGPYSGGPALGTPEGNVTATATFNIPSGYSGEAVPTSFSLSAVGQTLNGPMSSTVFEYATFINGYIAYWALSSERDIPGANISNPSVTIITTLSLPPTGNIPGEEVDQAGYAPNAGIATDPLINARNTNNRGAWNLSSYDTTVTVSPLAGQTQQLSAILTNPSLNAQGAIQNITVNGPGIVGVTGAVTIPAAGGPGTFTDNGTINLGALGTNVLNLDNVTLAGSGFIQQQGESDTTYVSSVSGVDFQVTAGTLELANPTGFNGTIGPVSATAGAAAIGAFGQVDVMNAISVASASFDTTTGMLSLLNSAGVDVGNIHFAGVTSGLRLSQEPARGSSSAYLAINDQGTSGNGAGGNIPLTFHA